MPSPFEETPLSNRSLWQMAQDYVLGATTDLSELDAIAEAVLSKAGPKAQEIWNKLLVSAKDDETCSKLASILSTEKFASYEEVVDKFTTPCARLIAVHVCNALIKNKIPCDAVYALHLEGFKPTRFILSGELQYSLLPFKEAYFPKLESFLDLFRGIVKKQNLTPHRCVDAGLAQIANSVVDLVPREIIWNYTPAKPSVMEPSTDGTLGLNPLSVSGML